MGTTVPSDETRVLNAIRELVIAAEGQGWDTEDATLREALDNGRTAYADLLGMLSPATPDTIAHDGTWPRLPAGCTVEVEYGDGTRDTRAVAAFGSAWLSEPHDPAATRIVRYRIVDEGRP